MERKGVKTMKKNAKKSLRERGKTLEGRGVDPGRSGHLTGRKIKEKRGVQGEKF